MNTNNINNGSIIDDKNFELLVKRNRDEKRMQTWAKEFGKTSEYYSNQEDNLKTKSFSLRYIVSSIAAIGIVLVAFVLNNNFSLDSYSRDLIESASINSEYKGVTRGEETRLSSMEKIESQTKISESIFQDDFSQTADLFRQYEQTNIMDNEDKYYFAIALLKVKNEDHYKAITLLTDIINSKESFHFEALWFRALGYGTLNNDLKMKLDLEELTSLSKFRNKDARKILNKLK